jgi:stage III sporulation protein AC
MKCLIYFNGQPHKGDFVMDVDLIFKIAAVGIIVTILSQVLKYSGREENAFMVTLAGLLIIMSWVLPYIQELFEMIQDLFSL